MAPEEDINGSPLSEELEFGQDGEAEHPGESTRPPQPQPAGQFEDGTPSYTTLQPNTRTNVAEQKQEIPGAPMLDPKKRVTQAEVSKTTPAAQPVTGGKNLHANPANHMPPAGEKAAKAVQAAKMGAQIADGDWASAASGAVQQIFGDSKLGKSIGKVVGVAAAVASAFALNFIPLIKLFWKPILIIGLTFFIASFAVGLTLYGSLGPHGNAPAGIAPGLGYAGSTCAQMSPTILNGRYTLTLSGTTGYYSDEEAVIPAGQPNAGYLPSGVNSDGTLKSGAGQIAMWNDLPSNLQSLKDADNAQWYFTARWPYASYTFNNTSNGAGEPAIDDGFKGQPPANAYAGVKAIIFNPKTGKAVVGWIGESGPNAKFIYPASQLAAQQTAWNTSPIHNPANGARIMDPTGYLGRVAGGGPAVQAALGNPDGTTTIQYGFAADQTLPLGPLTCTIVQHGNPASTGNVPQPLSVPLVNEGQGGECGDSSYIATILYYNPGYTNSSIFNASTKTINPGIAVCLSPGGINQNSLGKATDFTQARLQGATGSGATQFITFDDVVQSVTNGDPVIMYTSPDPFYGSAQHIVVITGYNSSAGTFDIMSPNTTAQYFNGKFGSSSPVAGTPITAAALTKYLGYNGGSEQFLIRAAYIPSGS